MPFLKKIYEIPTPIKSFIFVQKTLQCSNKEAQKILDRGRLAYLATPKIPIHKADTIVGKVVLEVFEPDGDIAPFFVHRDFALYHKPHNLLTHPKGRFEHASLCDSIKARFGNTANPAHRLDYETSGILLATTHKKSEVAFKKLFEDNQVKKTYLAQVQGIISQDRIIDLPILVPKRKDKTQDLGIKSQIHPDGKPSRTHIRVLGHLGESTLLEVRPFTGRTHQIRLHLASIGHAIIGEPLYGDSEQKAREYLKNKLVSENILRLQAKSLEFSYQGAHYYCATPVDF